MYQRSSQRGQIEPAECSVGRRSGYRNLGRKGFYDVIFDVVGLICRQDNSVPLDPRLQWIMKLQE